jgi:MoaA/NifB/PqqE/SkfB family radical SAM enzyme
MRDKEFPRKAREGRCTQKELKEFLMKKLSLSEQQYDLVCDYFEKRKVEAKEEESFGVVFAITQYCNLNCAHCAANAKLVREKNIHFELTTEQVFLIIDKIKDYIAETGFKLFLDFGGGEPTLRPDLEEILKYTANELGAQNISLSTNGTVLSAEDFILIGKYVGVIETSLDGFEKEHNSLRDPNKVVAIDNPFAKTYNFISSILRSPLRDKLQVASVILRRNVHSLPLLAKHFRKLGLKNYYILRRAMPVGRMLAHKEEILDATEYFHLFLQIAEIKKEDPNFKIRLHHSLESIYSALFIGEDIYETTLPMGSGKHSIGIDWNGFVYFDPWGLIPPFNLLRSGNLLERNTTLRDLMNDPQSILNLAGEIVKKNVRCKQCKMRCTGGMRFNAISHFISRYDIKSITKSHLIAGFTEIDPACPLYE